jgi:pimeloyl-ACP methyl ester carboxylesterase
MKRIIYIFIALALMLIIGIAFVALRPGDQSQSCMEYYAGMENRPAAAQEWCNAGEYFSWESTLPVNADFEALNIFHICQGNPENPAILMIHGYPTMSFDYAHLFNALKNDYYVCALDTVGPQGTVVTPKVVGYTLSRAFLDAKVGDLYPHLAQNYPIVGEF